jgi:hypothetical protein
MNIDYLATIEEKIGDWMTIADKYQVIEDDKEKDRWLKENRRERSTFERR